MNDKHSVRSAISRRDDMVAALKCQPAARVPIWELSFNAWDAASGRRMVLGEEFTSMTAAAQEWALRSNAEIMAAVCEEFDYAAVTLPNEFWEQAPGELAYYILPDVARLRLAELLRELIGNKVMLVAGTGGVMCANYDVDFCQKLVDAPEEIDALASNTLKRGIDTARKFRDVGVEAVLSSSDIADNAGPFFRPHHMKQFILPYLNDWADAAQSMGLFAILHTDGQITSLLKDIADTAVDAVQAIDPVAGMDMVEAKTIVGERLCLCGNIDCGLLISGTPQTVYDQTTTLLGRMLGRDGWALGASNAVQPEAPIAQYRAMIQAWRDRTFTGD